MFNPETFLTSLYVPSFETAARSLKVELITAPVHSDVEIETAIIALGREPGAGLVLIPDAFTLAHELVSLKPDIILTGSTNATTAVQQETRTIPIVFVAVTDPVASGLVPRLDRPSGNITGFADFEATLGSKWLELLSEIAPGLKRVANHVQCRHGPRIDLYALI